MERLESGQKDSETMVGQWWEFDREIILTVTSMI